jgi:hypothetical protein
MKMKPATKRRGIWGTAIFAVLVAFVIGILTFADTYALTEGAKRCAPSFLKSQWPPYIGCAMAAHEGLAGGLVGAAGALFAAWLAFDAIQEQLADERERELKNQREAKAAAPTALNALTQAAAAALAAINKALDATPEEQLVRDRLVDLMATHVQSTLNSFIVKEGMRELGLQDRLYYMAIIATLSSFVDVAMRPSPALDRIAALQSKRNTLLSLHRHLTAFDTGLAGLFADNSGTRPTEAPETPNRIQRP